MEDLHQLSKQYRKQIVHMHSRSRTSHLGSSLSAIDIINVLYQSVLKVDPKNPAMADRDRFILSKGHAAPALYVVLAHKGFFSKDLIERYGDEGTELFEHPERFSAPGIEVSTGSLGHGLSVSVGLALAAKLDSVSYRVFVLLSDGECQEGSTWEAAMMATTLRLDNLVCIVDYNNLQGYGVTDDIQGYEKILSRFQASGWITKEVDGHNLSELSDVLTSVPFGSGAPSLVMAKTVKGKGIPEIENKLEWHYKSPNPDEETRFLRELDNS